MNNDSLTIVVLAFKQVDNIQKKRRWGEKLKVLVFRLRRTPDLSQLKCTARVEAKHNKMTRKANKYICMETIKNVAFSEEVKRVYRIGGYGALLREKHNHT